MFYGGGISIYEKNNDITLFNSKIENCWSTSGGGISFYQNNNNVYIIQTILHNNSVSLYGGGIYFGSSNNDIILNSIIISSSSSIDGGAIYSSYSNKNLSLYQSSLIDNIAYHNGGGLYLYKDNKHLSIIGSNFTNNIAYRSGGGLYCLSNCKDLLIIDVDSYKQIRNLKFNDPFDSTSNNFQHIASNIIVFLDMDIIHTCNFEIPGYPKTASIDFAPGVSTNILIISTTPALHIEVPSCDVLYIIPILNNPTNKCVFENNTARIDGGAIYLGANNLFVKVINTNFYNNIANENGGAIYLESYNHGAIFSNNEIIGNIAKHSGGGLFVSSYNSGIKILKSKFMKNAADLSGGAIYFNLNNGKMILSNVIIYFINLFCKFLGDFFFPDDSYITIKYCIFKSNLALVSGGSIYSDNSNNLVLITSNMIDNRAYDGGAIYIKTNTHFYFSGTNQFIYNKAYRVGGAISCIDSYLWNENTAATMKISFNQALRGSAFYFLRLKDKSNLFVKSNLTISYNSAIVGGTIYWIYDNVMKAPDIDYLDIHNNFAPYGNKIATQAKYIDGPSFYDIKSYEFNASGIEFDPLLFKAYDYYNHSLVNVDNDKYFFSASVNIHSYYDCLGRTPSVSR